jgi:hypothetical protein
MVEATELESTVSMYLQWHDLPTDFIKIYELVQKITGKGGSHISITFLCKESRLKHTVGQISFERSYFEVLQLLVSEVKSAYAIRTWPHYRIHISMLSHLCCVCEIFC